MILELEVKLIRRNGPILSKDMQTLPSFPQKWSYFFWKMRKCAETIEKLIFRFLWFVFFELWLIFFTIFKCFYRPRMVKIMLKYSKYSAEKMVFWWKDYSPPRWKDLNSLGISLLIKYSLFLLKLKQNSVNINIDVYETIYIFFLK